MMDLSTMNAAVLLALPEHKRLEFYDEFFSALESGEIRASSFDGLNWIDNPWIRPIVLCYFQHTSSHSLEGHPGSWDKVPLQWTDSSIRRVPGSIVRRGAHIGKNCVLMPSFINIGAYVGQDTMIDTWSTVGSCAQIGKRCHISGGVGIGGVLEPLTDRPVIIEDDCFIGARCEIAEGVVVGAGSVLAPGVFLTQSTRIYDKKTKTISYGSIPPLSVVVPGSVKIDEFMSIAAAIIVKKSDTQTKNKTAINELLRSTHATNFQ